MVAIGSQSGREFPSYVLSRYACYIIAQNADPGKIEVAMAQTYFAIKTREKEVGENMVEDNKRVFLRNEMKIHNKNLAGAAKTAGVNNWMRDIWGYTEVFVKKIFIHVKN